MIGRFIWHYLFFLTVLGVIFSDMTPWGIWLNEWQRHVTLSSLSVLLDQSRIIGCDIPITPRYKIVITYACNGWLPLMLVWAGILAYPSSMRRKALWMSVSYIGLAVIANTLRLWFVVSMADKFGKDAFWWAHDMIGNIFLMASGLLFFYGFIKTKMP